MVPNIDYILLLGYSISYKGHNLTGFNHPKKATQVVQPLQVLKTCHKAGLKPFTALGLLGLRV